MKNALEKFRLEHGLSFERLAALTGKSVGAVWEHCKKSKIPAESAISYHLRLGIPLSDLRPDLQLAPPTSAPAQPQEHAAPQA